MWEIYVGTAGVIQNYPGQTRSYGYLISGNSNHCYFREDYFNLFSLCLKENIEIIFLHEYCIRSAAKFYKGNVFENLVAVSAAVFQAHIGVYIHYIF